MRGTDNKTEDGTCIRDYIDVTDLVDAHVKALEKAEPGKVGIYNVGTGRGKAFLVITCNLIDHICCFLCGSYFSTSGRSVKEFVEACKKATGVPLKVYYLPRRPGDYAEVYSDPTKLRKELNWTAKYVVNKREISKDLVPHQKTKRTSHHLYCVVSYWLVLC